MTKNRRSRTLTNSRALPATALLLLTSTASAAAGHVYGGRIPLPAGCEKLEVPAGNQLAFHAYAKGVQVYRWSGSAWIFDAPIADLFADVEGNGTVGIHYAGPTWKSVSGSKVVGAAIERCTVDPNAIPWLKLAKVTAEGPGIFQDVTFIQRVNTVGGTAPANPGNFPGEVKQVAYTAEYLFFRAP